MEPGGDLFDVLGRRPGVVIPADEIFDIAELVVIPPDPVPEPAAS